MLRILYCTDLLVAGGIERQLTELVTRLDRTRFEPQIIYLYGAKAGRSKHFAPRLREANIPLHTLDLGWTPLDKLRGILGILRLTWAVRPPILHALNYHSNLLTRLARPWLPPSLRLIGSVRGEYSAKQLVYERLSWRFCACIVCNSPHLQRQLVEQARVPAHRVLEIPNGVDTDLFARNPDPALRQRIAPESRRIAIMIGRISKQKSPHLLAQALGQLKQDGSLPPQTRVFIIGEQEDPVIRAQLDEAVHRYGLEDVITVEGQTQTPQAYYHAADFTVLASLWEGLPNVALESLASGRPVLISEAANAAGIIEPGKTGWVVRTGDVAHLAATLRTVLELPDEALTTMRAACLRRSQDFSMNTMVHTYERLYERLGAADNRPSTPVPHDQ
jgi:glycosyltransferase involved in cell wall biosynthesis